MPHKRIQRIHEERIPFKGHPILSGRMGADLAKEEYARAVKESIKYSREIGTPLTKGDLENPHKVFPTLMNLGQEMARNGIGKENQLKELAIRTVAEAHGVNIEVARKLIGDIEFKKMGAMGSVEGKPKKVEVPEKLKPYVEKRRTHNALIQGVSISHMNDAIHLARKDLEKINPGSFNKTMLFTNLAQVAQFHAPDEIPPGMPRASQLKVDWKGDNPRINASGESFPLLVQEMSKGLTELNFAHGLPKRGELTEKEAQTVIDAADVEAHEKYHFMMGPSLSRRVMRAFNKHDAIIKSGEHPDLPYTRTLLSMIPEDKLHENLHDLLSENEMREKMGTRNLKKAMLAAEKRHMEGR